MYVNLDIYKRIRDRSDVGLNKTIQYKSYNIKEF